MQQYICKYYKLMEKLSGKKTPQAGGIERFLIAVLVLSLLKERNQRPGETFLPIIASLGNFWIGVENQPKIQFLLIFLKFKNIISYNSIF